jgi:hypothetical protein
VGLDKRTELTGSEEESEDNPCRRKGVVHDLFFTTGAEK